MELSPHPTDKLIRALIRTNRTATLDELNQIIEKMTTAAFPSSTQHWRKHTTDGLWAIDTTEQEYLGDIYRAIRDARTGLLAYRRRGGNIAAMLTDTARIIPSGHLGPAWKPARFIVYSADRGIIVTAYQASDLSALAIPGDAQWLR